MSYGRSASEERKSEQNPFKEGKEPEAKITITKLKGAIGRKASATGKPRPGPAALSMVGQVGGKPRRNFLSGCTSTQIKLL